MEWIRCGRPEEGECLRAFAEECYRTGEKKPDFAEILPKVYKNPRDWVRKHLVLETEEGVKGQLCMGVSRWNVGGEILAVGHIGAVCVAAHYRGRGAMKRLMEEAMYLLEKEGCTFLALSGQRQRYERYDFVPAGTKQEYVFYRENVGDRAGEGYTLRPAVSEDLTDIERLFYQNSIYMERDRRAFFDILGSWSAQVLVLEKKGSVCGYCTLFEQEGYGVVSELRLRETELLKPLCAGLFDHGQAALKLCTAPGSLESEAAERLCERYIIGPDHNIRVLQFVPLVQALLKWKQQQGTMPKGRAVIPVVGERYLVLEVGKDTAVASWRSEERDGMALESIQPLSYCQLVHVLFSPLSAQRERLIAWEPLLSSWLPLYLCLEQNDCY